MEDNKMASGRASGITVILTNPINRMIRKVKTFSHHIVKVFPYELHHQDEQGDKESSHKWADEGFQNKFIELF